ncbi:MAG: WavQ [Pseudomonadota bacterium]
MKYIIFTSSWDEKIGGVVCLHKLCDTINRLGGQAFLYPTFDIVEFDRFSFFRSLRRVFKNYFRSKKTLSVNSKFITPSFYGDVADLRGGDWVVVYPEVIYGNPLGAKNVVRWLLHNPGFHTGKIGYSAGDVFFRFNSAIKDFSFYGAVLPGIDLKVIHYPTDLYNMKNIESCREGTAYCLRKGRDKKITHDLADSILIDNKPHAEVASIFKAAEIFYSYDTYTAYSLFAVMCGCKSVVIPDAGVPIESWYPDSSDRLGIAYGIDEIAAAAETADEAIKRVYVEIEESDNNVKKFISFCEAHFLCDEIKTC